MKENTKKIREIEQKIRDANKQNEENEQKVKEIRKTTVSVWDLMEQLSKLKHRYELKDIVILKQSHEMAEIHKLIGAKRYEVHIPTPLKHSCIRRIIYEDEILCHSMDIKLSTDAIPHYIPGWRPEK